MKIHQGGLECMSRVENGRPVGHRCLKLIQSWISHSMIDVQFLIHRSGIVIPEGSQRLTASPQAFTVPGQLTVTIEWSLDLVLIIGFMLHSINPSARYKRTYRKKALLIQYPSNRCLILFRYSATILDSTMKKGGVVTE